MTVRVKSSGGGGQVRVYGLGGGMKSLVSGGVTPPSPPWFFDFSPGPGAPNEYFTITVDTAGAVYGPNLSSGLGVPAYWILNPVFDASNIVAGSSLRSYGYHNTAFYSAGREYWLEAAAFGARSTLESTADPPTDRTTGQTSDDLTLWVTAETLSDPENLDENPWLGGLNGGAPIGFLVEVRTAGVPGTAVQIYAVTTAAIKNLIDP